MTSIPQVWVDQGRVYAQWPGGSVFELHYTGLVVPRMHVPATARPLREAADPHVGWDWRDRSWWSGS